MNFMHRRTLRDILLNRLLLAISLAGVLFFFFLPNRGLLEWSIRLSGMLLLSHIFIGDYQISTIPKTFFILLWITAILLLLSVIFSGPHTDTHRMYRVIKMLIIAFSVHCLSRGHLDERAFFLFGAILAILIVWQFIARSFIGMPYGAYSNPHYLANLASLTLPFLFYYFFVAPRPYNFLFVPLLTLMAIDLLLKTSSRPAILGLVVSTIFGIFFLVRSKRKWIALAAFAGACLLLYATNYANVTERIQNLIVNLPTEERVQFWADTWKMLKHNSLGAWLVGNGIGSFPDFFRIYSIPKYNFFSFPHNHLLQILFDNGLIGLLILVTAQALLLFLMVRLTNRAGDLNGRVFISCMTVVYVTWLIFSSLVFGFYSRFALYPFAFILGTALSLAEKSPGVPSMRLVNSNVNGFTPLDGSGD